MLKRKMLSILLAGLCFAGTVGAAKAEEIPCFSEEALSLEGLCITSLSGEGSFRLGTRVIREGDVLTKEQAGQVVYVPDQAEEAVEVGYLPVFREGLGTETALTLALGKKENKAPVAEDSAMETYKNLANTGTLKASDPEGEALTYTLTRQPRRGTVVIGEDGSFTYTPKKNKVGIDSFTYTASDAAGKTSREATVTVTILKPSEAARYTDTLGRECRFAAEWMRNTGIFVGETLGEESCFSPEREVTRGEFVTMLVKALDMEVDEGLVYTGYTDEVPKWLQPYLAAAVRSGLTAGLPDQKIFGAEETITASQAAVMVANATDRTAPTLAEDTALTREAAAVMLYEAAAAIK